MSELPGTRGDQGTGIEGNEMNCLECKKWELVCFFGLFCLIVLGTAFMLKIFVFA